MVIVMDRIMRMMYMVVIVDFDFDVLNKLYSRFMLFFF